MKNLLSIVVIVCLAIGGLKFYNYCCSYDSGNQPPKPDAAKTQPAVTPDQLAGMAPGLEPALQEARQRGAKGLKDFLARYGRMISDPRLGAIELDYVSMVGMTDAGEARRVFTKVKERTPSSSPLYNQVQQMSKTFE